MNNCIGSNTAVISSSLGGTTQIIFSADLLCAHLVYTPPVNACASGADDIIDTIQQKIECLCCLVPLDTVTIVYHINCRGIKAVNDKGYVGNMPVGEKDDISYVLDNDFANQSYDIIASSLQLLNGSSSTNIAQYSINPITHVIEYTSNGFYNGTDTVYYQICDTNIVCDTGQLIVYFRDSIRLERPLTYVDVNQNCIYDNNDIALMSALTDFRLMASHRLAYYNYNGTIDTVEAGAYLNLWEVASLINLPNQHQDSIILAVTFGVENPYIVSCGGQSNSLTYYYTYGGSFLNFIPTTIPLYLDSSVLNCSVLLVDIGCGVLRRCSTSYYSISYKNLGGQTANAAYIDVQLDEYLTPSQSVGSLPYTINADGSLRFDIGDVNPLQAGYIYFDVLVDCSIALGYNHCVTATTYPHPGCGNDTLPYVEVDSLPSISDSGMFRILNPSNLNMNSATEWRVYEEDVLYKTGTIQLNASQSITIAYPHTSTNGYRIEVDQVEGVSNLVADNTPAISSDNQTTDIGFSASDGELWQSTFCRTNVDSYDPNEKLGFPIGYGANHFINKETELDYVIHFQNEGTADANQVVVKDVIDSDLDISTFTAGASSHPYTMQIVNNEAIFQFNNINLTPKTTNEAASMGFVKYTIRQKANNPVGTLIHNTAAIYFDFNSPITTNTTLHTIGEKRDYEVKALVLAISNTTTNLIQVKTYPNPATDILYFEIVDIKASIYELEVMDITGKQVQKQVFQANKATVNVESLSPGMYVYTIKNKMGEAAIGKIIVR